MCLGSAAHFATRHNMKIPIDILRKLPKAELHLHLDGSVRPLTVIELAKEQGVELPTFDEDELKQLICVPMDCKSLEDYLKGFEITLRVLQKHYAIVRAMFELCEDAVKDGVTYIEVRFSPVLHTNDGLALSGVMEAICEGRSLAQQRLPITVRIIVCGMRHMPSSVSRQLAEITWRYRERGVVGFDLAGPEKGFSSKAHREAYELVRSKNLNATLHAGEAAGPEYIKDSIRFCGAQRIGHGVSLINDADLMQYVVDKRIAIEVCITSNVQTKACTLLDHPVRKFFDAGVIVAPSCDNRTVSNVTLTSEYELLQQTFDFTVEEIVRMLDFGFDHSFLEYSQRRRLRAEAFRTTMLILQSAGIDVSAVFARAYYYDDIGVSRADLTVPVDGAPRAPFWGQFTNPALTLAALRELPKADLHCRFDGSMSPRWLWSQMGDDPSRWLRDADLGITAGDFDAFRQAMQQRHHTDESIEAAKRVCRKLTQTEEQLRGALRDIIEIAAEDGVTYIELVIRTKTHCKEDLTPEQVVNTLYSEAAALYAAAQKSNKPGVRVSLILYVSLNVDDPLAFKETAELCVSMRDKVVGFGVCGKGDHELTDDTIRYFLPTFYFLKNNNVNVVIYAGNNDARSITTALHQGGASRVSGAFRLHEHPEIIEYLATHDVSLELAPTTRMRESTVSVESSIGGSLFQLLLDNNLNVTICSFRLALQPLSRCELLLTVYKSFRSMPGAENDIAHIVQLFGNSFKSNFLPYQDRDRMYKEYIEQSTAILTARGYRFFKKLFWFPDFPQNLLSPKK